MPEVDCSNCGATVERPQSKIERNDRHFCNRECYHDFGRVDMRGEGHHMYKGGKVEKTCDWCGEAFKVYPHRSDTARFCSRECEGGRRTELLGEDSPHWKGGGNEYTCLNCGDPFREYEGRNDHKYCSESCYREASKQLFAGENNPAWRGGWDWYYGPNWDEQREKALERDGYACQECGKHADEMRRSPDVHHEKRIGWFKEEYDGPEWWEKGNAVDNLTTLCPYCHVDVEWGPKHPD